VPGDHGGAAAVSPATLEPELSHSVPQQIRQQVNVIWEADLSLQLMLLFLVVTLFVLVPIAGLGFLEDSGEMIVAAGFTFLGISGVFAVTMTRGARILGLLAMTAPIGLGWYEALVPGGRTASELRSLLVISAILWLAFLTLQHVFRAGAITKARLQGAVAVYLLLALAFGECYWLILQLQPDAFHFADPPSSPWRTRSSLFYFSMITLTTLGYGDILPSGAVARSFASMEGLIGQLYPVVLIGRLVSLQMMTTAHEVQQKAKREGSE
jgi:hypothetical protein